MCGFIAQLVEHRTGIAEVTGSNPVEALIFFRLLLSNCLNWKIYCESHVDKQGTEFFQTTNSNEIFPSKAIARKITLSKSARFYFEQIIDFS